MKRFFINLMMMVFVPISLLAQDPKVNPLNYSGKMYVSSMEIISTPRYVSYGDHAILNTELSVPTVEETPVVMDFVNNMITLPTSKIQVKNVEAKTYYEGLVETVVISMRNVENNSLVELVWPGLGSPYLMMSGQGEDGDVFVVKFNLAKTHTMPSEEALLEMLFGVF